jgi:hypothetical protein
MIDTGYWKAGIWVLVAETLLVEGIRYRVENL